MVKKWTKILLDLKTHRWLEKIQDAEVDRFGWLKRRKKEDIIEDCLKLGIKEFIKTHDLNIKL